MPGARIPIVEDNHANRELMAYLLTAFGHTVLSAENGLHGVTLSCSAAPHLILSDVQLPDVDGFELARRLHDEPLTRAIPLVAVTALAMVGDRERVLAGGFDGYLPKPIDPETFVQKIEDFLLLPLRTLPAQEREH
ncbi:MAG: response regulator [Ignavibacteriota bacterium]